MASDVCLPDENIELTNEDGEESDNEESWVECDVEENQNQTAKCLFCQKIYRSANEIFQHCKSEHDFNLDELAIQWNLDAFKYIRLVNYIRKRNPCPSALQDDPTINAILLDDKWMKPVDESDLLLQYDVERDEMCQLDEPRDLKPSIVEEKLAENNREIQRMRTLLRDLIKNDASDGRRVNEKRYPEDNFYIESYSHFSIHLEMLLDRVRTEAYRDAIYKNAKSTIEGKTVLDVGCGTGILCLFAAGAGASRVVGVEFSDIAIQAMDVVRENRLGDRILVLKGRMEEVDLPVPKVDVIVSEWMGYFLLFECMLETVLFARDRYLAPGGVLLPSRLTLYIAAISDMESHGKLVTFWDDVYGFKMSCMKPEVLREVNVEIVKAETVLTDSFPLKTFDMMTCTADDIQFVQEIQLVARDDGQITALVGYFDCHFDLAEEKVYFSTGPDCPPTHWKQSVFYLPEPIKVIKGDILIGKLSCSRSTRYPRSLKVTLNLRDKMCLYFLQ